jgi:hypothetical protein
MKQLGPHSTGPALAAIAIAVMTGLAAFGPAAIAQTSSPAAPAAAPTTRPAAPPADTGRQRPPESAGQISPAREITAADSVRAVVDRLLTALGGREAYAGMKSLRLTFAVSVNDTVRTSRTHWWNRVTGDYRVQGKGRDGQEYVVLFNVGSRRGRAALGGRELAGDELAQWLERGYGLFINDTYWLLMPFKLEDPGVRLRLTGTADFEGIPCARLEVTFDKVGLTPGDTYWVYVDRTTGRMPGWGFLLEGERDKPDAAETRWAWTDWSEHGGLMLAGRKWKQHDPARTEIRLGDLDVNGPLPAEAFSGLAPIAVRGESR